MGCDMLAALGSATVERRTLVGMNYFLAGRERCRLRHLPASHHTPDETIFTAQLALPQVRSTHAVLGLQSEGAWGLIHGCNEHQVVLGVSHWRSRMPPAQPGLSGADLVRLGLERSHSARHAIEVLTDLMARHGHGIPDTSSASAFLVADPNEAYLLEAAGSCWALLECRETRAVADVAMIRQDWQRLSPGLAERAIQESWWKDDGTKLDFVGCLGHHEPADAWALRRWSRATLAAAQHAGNIDTPLMRRLLLKHFETTVGGHDLAPQKTRLLASLIISLDERGVSLIWVACEGSAARLYFPLVLGADLPAKWLSEPTSFHGSQLHDVHAVSDLTERLQAQFDQDAADFQAEARTLRERGELPALRRLAGAMMQKHLEEWESEARPSFRAATPVLRQRAKEEAVPFFG
jgi:hypothetical protein